MNLRIGSVGPTPLPPHSSLPFPPPPPPPLPLFSLLERSFLLLVIYRLAGLVLKSLPSSAFPAVPLGFIIILRLLLRSQLYHWGSTFFSFFCVPSCISGVHHSSSSSTFPAISLGFVILLLRSQLYLWGSSFFFFCILSYISEVHHSR